MEGGGFAAARPSIVRKEVVALLLEIEATCPLNSIKNILYMLLVHAYGFAT